MSRNLILILTAGAVLSTMGMSAAALDLTSEEELGKSIFFDEGLSIDRNQSCATCHDPDAGWTGPDSTVNFETAVYQGSIDGRFGNRKPPSSAYATPSPVLYYVLEKKKSPPLFIGGNFWDGRATGEKLGNPAADQAQGPFLNPLEQALPDYACVVYRVCNPVPAYTVDFEDVFPGACAITWPANVETACATEGGMVVLSSEDRAKAAESYDSVALSIAAYEASPASNAYTSKYDAYLAGAAELTKLEKKGLNLFQSTGKCAACHVLDPGPNGEPALLTDFTFDNLGVPRNPGNPFYNMGSIFNPDGDEWIDMGLGDFLFSRPEYAAFAADNYGKVKVPTLRNVDMRPYSNFVKAYAHNGYFKTLKQIVHFYSTRDMKPVCPDDPVTTIDESLFTPVEEAIAKGCWPEPEVAVNVNTSELGKLNLSEKQEDAIVAFLKTLTDGDFAR